MRIFIGVLACVAALIATGLSNAAIAAVKQSTAIVQSIGSDTIVLAPGGDIHFGANFKNLKQYVTAGDKVAITVVAGARPTLISLSVVAHRIRSLGAAGTFFVWFAVILGIAALATKGDPRKFIIGMDGRYSNSKTQLAFWFATIFAAYLAMLSLRVLSGGWGLLGGVAIPEHLLVLSGLSALTYGGAKAITTQKVNSVTDAGGISPKTTATAPSIKTDLFQNDQGEADIGDFQMIFVTLTAVVIFTLSAINHLALIDLGTSTTLPDVDSTLLSAFGLGQGAYLVKKLASNPGQG